MARLLPSLRATQVGCPEFTLLLMLMTAGVAQQQLQAVHGFAGSISRVFTGVCAAH